MSNLLTIQQLCKDTPTRSILYNLDLNITNGTITSLLGLDGDGKEELLAILAGLKHADSGNIIFNDKAYSPRSITAALKAGVLLIPENPHIAPDLTIKEALTLGLPAKSATISKKSVLKRTGLDKLSLNTLCRSLTAAETRMLLLSRALLSSARLYLFNKLDNAFSKEERNLYFSIIKELKNNGHTVIFIPALLSDLHFADNFCIIRNGSVLSATDTLPDINKTIYADDTGSIFPKQTGTRNNTIIMESLGLKGTTLKDASINIRQKEVCGIYGLKGSGIDELITILTGRYSSTGGVLAANKTNLQAKKISPAKRLKAGITIFDGRQNSDLDYDGRNLQLRTLSGNILLLLDPAYGLNFSERKNFYTLINELKTQGKAIILFTTSLTELRGISDTIAIMHNGELSATRSTNNWTDEEIYKYVTSGKLEAFSIL